MRTSLNSIKAIDDYLLGHLAPGDAALFETNMMLNSDLMENVMHQQKTHAIIKQYGRQQIRAEIAAVHNILATAPQYQDYMQSVANFFKRR